MIIKKFCQVDEYTKIISLDFLRRYNNKDIVPTLQAMKKMMKFYNDQKIDLLKLGCTLPNLLNICLHKSTDSKFYTFIEVDKDLHEKRRSEMTGGPSIVFIRKAVVEKTFIRRSRNICKAIVGIDASQLYPCAKRCQLDSTLDGSFIPIVKSSKLVKTKSGSLRAW